MLLLRLLLLAAVRCLALDQLKEDVVRHAIGSGATSTRTASELPIGLAAPAATALDLLRAAEHGALATTAALVV